MDISKRNVIFAEDIDRRITTMKKRLLILLSVLPLAVAAQENAFSFLVEGKTWVTCTFDYHPAGYVSVNEMCLRGDTIIDDIHFMRVYNRSYTYGNEPPQEWIAQRHLIGQNGTKLYHRYEGMTGRYRDAWMFMDLDFTKTAGDSIMTEACEGTPWLYDILSVSDTVLANSTDKQIRKNMRVKAAWRPFTDDIWIEGVGSVTSGIEDYVLGENVGGFCQLIKCYVDDKVFYEHEFDKNTPQYVSLGISSRFDSKQQHQALFDLQGRRVEGQPRSGVYIQDGRKRVVR